MLGFPLAINLAWQKVLRGGIFRIGRLLNRVSEYVINNFVRRLIRAGDILDVQAMSQPLPSHFIEKAAVISVLSRIKTLSELVSAQVDHARSHRMPGFVSVLDLLFLWLLSSKDVVVGDNEALRVVNRASLSSLETDFVD